jgi:inorganic pyrophosphatase
MSSVPRTGQRLTDQGGETDWKVLAIDVNDPLAPLIDGTSPHALRVGVDRADFEDVEKYRPGVLTAYRDWWTYYKVARGDEPIPIVGHWYQNASFTEHTVEESHGFWSDLVNGKVDSNSINYNQTSQSNIQGSHIASSTATESFDIPTESNELPAQPKPSQFDQWYYLAGGVKLIEVPEKA